MPRFVWLTAVAVEAATLEEAGTILDETYGCEGWNATAVDAIAVWTPGGDPHEILEDDERVGDRSCTIANCTCPPGLVERGGFRSSCPEHGTGLEARQTVEGRVDEAIFRIRDSDADFLTADSVAMWASSTEAEAQAGIDRWIVAKATHLAVNISPAGQPQRNLHYVALCGADRREGVSLAVWAPHTVTCPRCIAVEHAKGATVEVARAENGLEARA